MKQAIESRFLAGLLDAVGAWQKRSRDRYVVSELSDWQQRDIGLSRDSLDDATSTPLWRVTRNGGAP